MSVWALLHRIRDRAGDTRGAVPYTRGAVPYIPRVRYKGLEYPMRTVRVQLIVYTAHPMYSFSRIQLIACIASSNVQRITCTLVGTADRAYS